MENQTTVNKEAKNLSPCSSGRRSGTNSHSSSPEFEFWMVRNPSFPQPDLISADELFVNGVLLPLHILPNKQPEENPEPIPNPPASEPPLPDPESEPGPPITSEPLTVLSASKRWRDIFKKEKGKNGTKNPEDKDKEKEKEKKKEKKNQSQSGASPAELNINIWPFSRSRSAGTSGTRPRMASGAVGTRKVSSAPCSRSNSAGESKSRKWPSSPSRAGVHLGRSSPVWQVRRGSSGVKNVDVLARSAEKSSSKKAAAQTRRCKISNAGNTNKAKVSNLNVPMCIGYRHHLSCRTEENSAILAGISTDSNGGRGGSGGNGRSSGPNVGSGGNFFNLRNLFTKKVY